MPTAPDVVSPVVRVRLLGTIEVETEHGLSTVGGLKVQALLAMLALAVPRDVTDDRLLEQLWDDARLADPTNALQAQIVVLRRLLGRDVVVRHSSGYRLALAPDDIDVHRLEGLVHAGRDAGLDGDHRRSLTLFEQAVALHRGDPLAALTDFPFAQAAAAHLTQVVVDAHRGHIAADLALGHHEEVVGPLQALVEQHPLDEGLRGQLMTALYRCGRQSDALRVYSDARATLAEEVGLDPGPELQAMERSVLSQDPALDAPVPLTSIGRLAVLPIPLTSFVGRVAEQRVLAAATAATRLVTIVGPAGVGKTRLALVMADAVAAERELWFVELAAVSDPRSVPAAVADALGARDLTSGEHGSAGAPGARIIERLGDREVLVVLDNCEHVLDAVADLVGQLLSSCRRLSIVATSRQPLGIPGEHQVPLEPMSDDDAAALFVERAVAVDPRFGVDDAALVELCRRLDRLPLAIELAAARTKSLPVPEITSRLNDRFHLLVGARAAVDRYDGLRGAIDWSYDLLFDDERTVFRRFGVFAGGATLEAAEVVCGPDAMDVIARLVDKSLLVADTSGPLARFRMLESLRAYALSRLEETGERDEVLATHRAWAAVLTADAAAGVRTPDQERWLDLLDAEHDNLVAALADGVGADPITALGMIGALVVPWWFRGRGREARRWLEVCLATVDEHTSTEPAVGAVLTWSGMLADFGDADEPGPLVDELYLAGRRQHRAVAIAAANGDDTALAYARAQLALTTTRLALAGQNVDAAEVSGLLAAAIAAHAADADEFGGGMVRTIECVTFLSMGHRRDAAQAVLLAARHAAASGDRFVTGRVEWILGVLAETDGDLDAAYRHIERGLRLLDQLGMGREVTAQATLLSDLAARLGEQNLAEQWQTFVSGRRGGLSRHDALLRASARNAEALSARRDGELRRARQAHLDALDLYTDTEVAAAIAHTHSMLAFLEAQMGDDIAAAAHHVATLDTAVGRDDPVLLALALDGAAARLTPTAPQDAATLLAAAQVVWENSGERPFDVHVADVAAVTDRLRDALGDDEFDHTLARGVAISRDDAIRLADGSGRRRRR